MKKPDWITDQEWKAVPNVQWWWIDRIQKQTIAKQKPLTQQEVEQMLSKSENNPPSKKQKPVTPEEAIAQFRRLRMEANWKDE